MQREIVVAAVFLLAGSALGSLGGGYAGYQYGRKPVAPLRRELASVKASLATAEAKANDLESREQAISSENLALKIELADTRAQLTRERTRSAPSGPGALVIQRVTNNGEFIQMTDGTLWKPALPRDRELAASWSVGTQLVRGGEDVFGIELINRERAESVVARSETDE